MLYHADYYTIIVNEYDYECRAVDDYEHHASFHYICTYGGGLCVCIYICVCVCVYVCVCPVPMTAVTYATEVQKKKIFKNETSINKIQYPPPPPKKKRGGGGKPGGGERKK